MLNAIFGNTADRFQIALDRTSKRHGLLTQNLANVNTPGYKRQDCDFTLALDEATGEDREFGRIRHLARFDNRETRSETNVRVDGNSVDMEKEVSTIAETELRYQMLTEFTSRYFGGMKNVIREGR